MQWEYANVIYQNGLIGTHAHESLAKIEERDLEPFLRHAGEQGWEVCGTLPQSGADSGDRGSVVIFKRPIAPSGH